MPIRENSSYIYNRMGGVCGKMGLNGYISFFLQFFVQIMLDQLIFFLVLWELIKDHSMKKKFTLGQR